MTDFLSDNYPTRLVLPGFAPSLLIIILVSIARDHAPGNISDPIGSQSGPIGIGISVAILIVTAIERSLNAAR